MFEVLGVICFAAAAVLCWRDYRATRGGSGAAIVFGVFTALWGAKLLLEAAA